MSDATPADSSIIRFRLDGETVAVAGLPATTTVLEYLREQCGRSGTKEGCAEGDCGACTVVIGEPDPDGEHIDYRAINACIRFLPTLDGKELITVESLRHGERLHPVQQALADSHGSQCGFCTPGFVMALFALYLNEAAPSREQVMEALSGNLCRCTGYRPIIEAGLRMAEYPQPAHWSRAQAQSSAHRADLQALRREAALRLPNFHAPTTLTELAEILAAEPEALILAGGTDIGLWVTKQLRCLPTLVYLGAIEALQRIRRTEQFLEIGAAVSLHDAWQAIVAIYPQLAEVAQRFGSPAIRNGGTLCGNLANGSPIGDSMPALLALDAELELRCGAQTRRLDLDRFYLGYRKKDLRAGEYLTSVRIPMPRANRRLGCYKLAKRWDQDISAVCAAFAIEVRDDYIHDARIAYGGMAPIPARAPRTEAALIGQPWHRITIETACAHLAEDYSPLSDARASAGYRLQAAANLLRRFYLQQEGSISILRIQDVLHEPS